MVHPPRKEAFSGETDQTAPSCSCHSMTSANPTSFVFLVRERVRMTRLAWEIDRGVLLALALCLDRANSSTESKTNWLKSASNIGSFFACPPCTLHDRPVSRPGSSRESIESFLPVVSGVPFYMPLLSPFPACLLAQSRCRCLAVDSSPFASKRVSFPRCPFGSLLTFRFCRHGVRSFVTIPHTPCVHLLARPFPSFSPTYFLDLFRTNNLPDPSRPFRPLQPGGLSSSSSPCARVVSFCLTRSTNDLPTQPFPPSFPTFQIFTTVLCPDHKHLTEPHTSDILRSSSRQQPSQFVFGDMNTSRSF